MYRSHCLKLFGCCVVEVLVYRRHCLKLFYCCVVEVLVYRRHCLKLFGCCVMEVLVYRRHCLKLFGSCVVVVTSLPGVGLCSCTVLEILVRKRRQHHCEAVWNKPNKNPVPRKRTLASNENKQVQQWVLLRRPFVFSSHP